MWTVSVAWTKRRSIRGIKEKYKGENANK